MCVKTKTTSVNPCKSKRLRGHFKLWDTFFYTITVKSNSYILLLYPVNRTGGGGDKSVATTKPAHWLVCLERELNKRIAKICNPMQNRWL